MTDDKVQILSREDAKRFILAGRAEFSLRSIKTDKYYTYTVQRPKGPAANRYLVVLVERHDHEPLYIGAIVAERNFSYSKKMTEPTPSALSFYWFWRYALTDDAQWAKCEMYHLGRCAKCHRRLTDPVSITTGMGPICAGRL